MYDFEGILPQRSCVFVWLLALVTYLDVTGSAGKRLGSLGCNPNIPHLEVGEITSWDIQVAPSIRVLVLNNANAIYP